MKVLNNRLELFVRQYFFILKCLFVGHEEEFFSLGGYSDGLTWIEHSAVYCLRCYKTLEE